ASLVERYGADLSIFVQPDAAAISADEQITVVFPKRANADARNAEQGIQMVIGDSEAKQPLAGGDRDLTRAHLRDGERSIAVVIGLRVTIKISDGQVADGADADGIGHI